MGKERNWRERARHSALKDIANDDGKHLAGVRKAGGNERWDVKASDLNGRDTARKNRELSIHVVNRLK